MIHLLLAIAFVESSFTPMALGDGGAALGLLQIHKVVVDDVNRVYGKTVEYHERIEPFKTMRRFDLYIKHWLPKAKRNGATDMMDEEIIARIWNGGPNGWKKDSTIDYWHKVAKYLHSGR